MCWSIGPADVAAQNGISSSSGSAGADLEEARSDSGRLLERSPPAVLHSSLGPPPPPGRLPSNLHRLADDAELAPLLAALLVVPGVELQPAFDENRAALFQIFAGDFREARPEDDVDEGDFFALFAVFEGVLPIDRKAEIADRAAFGRVADFGVAREVPERE